MALSLLTTVVDCTDPLRQATFWAAALDYDARERNAEEYLAADRTRRGAPLYFMKVPEPRQGKNRLHIDVLSDGPMPDAVDRLVKLGARVVEVRADTVASENPDTWTVMEDPEGNVFCVIDGSTFSGWV